MENQTSNKPPSKHAIRIYGAVLFVIGLIVVLLFIVKPLYDAHNGAAEIVLRQKIGIGGFAVSVFGFALLVLGEKAMQMLPPEDGNTDLKDIPLVCWITMIIMVAVMVSGWFWLEGHLDSLGFSQS